MPQATPSLDFLGSSGDSEKAAFLLKLWKEIEPLQIKFRAYTGLVRAQELNEQGKSNANVSAMEQEIANALQKHEPWYQLCRGNSGSRYMDRWRPCTWTENRHSRLKEPKRI